MTHLTVVAKGPFNERLGGWIIALQTGKIAKFLQYDGLPDPISQLAVQLLGLGPFRASAPVVAATDVGHCAGAEGGGHAVRVSQPPEQRQAAVP